MEEINQQVLHEINKYKKYSEESYKHPIDNTVALLSLALKRKEDIDLLKQNVSSFFSHNISIIKNQCSIVKKETNQTSYEYIYEKISPRLEKYLEEVQEKINKNINFEDLLYKRKQLIKKNKLYKKHNLFISISFSFVFIPLYYLISFIKFIKPEIIPNYVITLKNSLATFFTILFCLYKITLYLKKQNSSIINKIDYLIKASLLAQCIEMNNIKDIDTQKIESDTIEKIFICKRHKIHENIIQLDNKADNKNNTARKIQNYLYLSSCILSIIGIPLLFIQIAQNITYLNNLITQKQLGNCILTAINRSLQCWKIARIALITCLVICYMYVLFENIQHFNLVNYKQKNEKMFKQSVYIIGQTGITLNWIRSIKTEYQSSPCANLLILTVALKIPYFFSNVAYFFINKLKKNDKHNDKHNDTYNEELEALSLEMNNTGDKEYITDTIIDIDQEQSMM